MRARVPPSRRVKSCFKTGREKRIPKLDQINASIGKLTLSKGVGFVNNPSAKASFAIVFAQTVDLFFLHN